MNKSHKIAFLTGASRGIGKQTALALARKGYDVVVTARTLHEGERHERGTTKSDTSSVAGSLDTTAAEVKALGQRVLPIRLDLLDTDSIDQAVKTTLQEWGHIDLLVNNGIYQGLGTLNYVLDITPEQIKTIYQGNVFSQLHLIQRVLPQMIERNCGHIINMVSMAGMMDPPLPADKGGWGFAYSSSKAAFMRLVGVLKVEHAASKLLFHNVEPGLVITEFMKKKGMAERYAKQFGGAPPTVPAAVIAWLATNPAAANMQGETVSAQRHCLKHQLVPDWQPTSRNA